jgi:hypothetical protein
MAGNPSCPVKSEKRQEKNQRTKLTSDVAAASTQQHHKQAWISNTNEHLLRNKTSATTNASPTYLNSDVSNSNNSNNNQKDITNILDKIHNKMN